MLEPAPTAPLPLLPGEHRRPPLRRTGPDTHISPPPDTPRSSRGAGLSPPRQPLPSHARPSAMLEPKLLPSPRLASQAHTAGPREEAGEEGALAAPTRGGTRRHMGRGGWRGRAHARRVQRRRRRGGSLRLSLGRHFCLPRGSPSQAPPGTLPGSVSPPQGPASRGRAKESGGSKPSGLP